MRLILASASPSRRRLLQDAGLEPECLLSGVDESGVDHLSPAAAAEQLAVRKASAVADRLEGAALVIGCDSLLEFEGRTEGKPSSPKAARALWRRLRGNTGVLHTGHCVIHTGRHERASTTDSALIRFGDPSNKEIEAYVATGEPERVAGGFTLEGFGAPWIDSIDGNYGTVTGLSLPVLRRLLHELDVEIVDLWRRPGAGDFRARVEAVVASLAPGEVVSYGDVAAEAGFPGSARAVGAIMANPSRRNLPWWRVVTSTGRLVPGHEARHAKLLKAEGVAVVDGRVARPGKMPR